jgi:hypothetical protein
MDEMFSYAKGNTLKVILSHLMSIQNPKSYPKIYNNPKNEMYIQ